MTKSSLSALTRREFWFLAAGMASLVVGCSRQQTATESLADSRLSPSESRTITHALGATQVPKTPQRIVALTGITDLEALLVLGVKPLAAAGDDRTFGRIVWHPHLREQMQEVEMLPSRRNISLEKIATLQPDLMLGVANQIEPVYSQLSQIAPTVAIDPTQPWQDSLRLVAEVVDETEQAETWILDFEQRIENLANAYGESIAGTTYTTLSYQPGQRQFHMVIGHDLDEAFQQIGLTRPSEQRDIAPVGVGGLRRADISLERLDLIDTDLLFFYNYQYPTIQRVDELPELRVFLEQEPLLRGLRAIETGRAFVVPANYWFLGRSMGIPLAVDDLEAAVLPLLT